MPTLYDNFSQVKQYIDQEKPDLTSYVTKTELANCSYVTSADLPVIDENIIPKENKTYTLGNNDYQYSATYTYFVGAYNSGILIDTAHGFVFNINGNNRFTIANSTMRPIQDNYFKFGTDTQRWKSTYVVDTYTSNLYADTIHNFIWTGTQAEYDLLPNYTTYQFYLITENE